MRRELARTKPKRYQTYGERKRQLIGFVDISRRKKDSRDNFNGRFAYRLLSREKTCFVEARDPFFRGLTGQISSFDVEMKETPREKLVKTTNVNDLRNSRNDETHRSSLLHVEEMQR